MTSDGMGPKGPGGGLGIDRGLGGEVGDEATSVIELTGVIKWFDVSKGYGFIVPDNGMPDILLHVTCLRRDGHQVAYEGARVVVEVLQRPRGLQAFRILSIPQHRAERSESGRRAQKARFKSTHQAIAEMGRQIE